MIQRGHRRPVTTFLVGKDYPYGDWLSTTDLFVGDMPQHYSGSIRLNQLLRQGNQDIELLHQEESLLGFPDQDDRLANRVVMLKGQTVRELSLLDQAGFYEVGFRPGQGIIDDYVLLRSRNLKGIAEL